LAKKKAAAPSAVLLIPEDHIEFWDNLFPGLVEPTGMRALFALRALARAINEAASAWLEPLHLTPAKYNYLVALYVAKGRSLMLNEIGRSIHTSNASVTGMIAALERDELVIRSENPNDGRSMVVKLTRRGTRLLERAFPLHHENMERILEGVSVADRATLLRIVLQIGAGLERGSP
jgi:DNA-binding MarR family transcriptional regulator